MIDDKKYIQESGSGVDNVHYYRDEKKQGSIVYDLQEQAM